MVIMFVCWFEFLCHLFLTVSVGFDYNIKSQSVASLITFILYFRKMSTSKTPKLAPIQVYVRIRPTVETDGPSAIKSCNTREIVIKGHAKSFSFDQIFNNETSQAEVYRTVVSKKVSDVMKGYNCTIFAYGQTGTGKTYTILGNTDSTDVTDTFSWEQDTGAGIIQRAALHLYEELDKLDQTIQKTVTVSFMEIYNEEIRDLLCDKELAPLRIFEDKSRSVHVKNLQEVTVLNPWEIFNLLKKGCEKRQVASTLMNSDSSRSHTVFTITVNTIHTISVAENLSNITCGKLNLIDLAGSENIAKSGSKEQRAREASNINQSLLTLGRVIKALVENSSHIPYRESKLTRILQDSLGGKTKTSIIATISPGVYSVDETLNTLDYAHNARNVTNCPTINLRTSAYAAAVHEELIRLKRDLFATANAEGVYMEKENYEEMTKSLAQYKKDIISKHVSIRTLSEQIDDLIAQKEEWDKLRESFEITRRRYQECQTENQINKGKIEKDNLLINYYETESEKLQKYLDMMKQREKHLHQKVDNLYAASINNHNVIDTVNQTVERIMEDLMTQDEQNSQQVAQTISRLIDFNENVCQMSNNVSNEFTTNSQKRVGTTKTENGSLQSGDPFSLHINNMQESVNLAEHNFSKFINYCNDKMNEINQKVECIESCRRDADLVSKELERTTLGEISKKESVMKKLWDKFDKIVTDLSSPIKVENDVEDGYLEKEYDEILRDEEKLNARKQRLLRLRKMRNEINLESKMAEYEQSYHGIRTKMCDLEDLKQNVTLCSALEHIRNVENETFKILQKSLVIQNSEELIRRTLENMRKGILQTATYVYGENSRTASVLNQISSILDIEGKTHLVQLKQMDSMHSDLVKNAGQETIQNIRQIVNSSVVPVVRTGDTPQRSNFQVSSHHGTRDSLIRRLQTDFSRSNS